MRSTNRSARGRLFSLAIAIAALFALRSSLFGQFAEWPPMPERAFDRLRAGDLVGFLTILRDQAQAGDAASALYLGQAYESVKGVPHDFLEAQKWYRVAAERGSGPGAWYLGCLYERGKGLTADKAQALKWFVRASELGYRRRAFAVSYIRWYPGPEPLHQDAVGGSPDQLSREEMALLRDAGTSGRLTVEGQSKDDCGVPARLIVLAQSAVKEEVALALPIDKTVIYRQDKDGWTKIPAEARTGDKKLRLAPQDAEHPEYTSGTIEKDDGSESGGSAYFWR